MPTSTDAVASNPPDSRTIIRTVYTPGEANRLDTVKSVDQFVSQRQSPSKSQRTRRFVRGSSRSETADALNTIGVFTSHRVLPIRRSAVGHVFVRLIGRARGKRSVHVPVPNKSFGLSTKPSGSGQTSWDTPLH